MESWRGHDGFCKASMMCGTNAPAPSVFIVLDRFLTFSRDVCRTSENVELLSPTYVICEVSFSTWASFIFEQLQAPWKNQAHAHVLPLHGPQPTMAHGADPAPRGHGLMRKLRSVAAEVLAMMHINSRSDCVVKEHRLGSPRWSHTNSSAMSHARHQNRSFRSKKLIFRELDRPFETAP